MANAVPPIDFRIRKNRMLRAAVFTRDDFTCQICGWRPDFVPDDYDGLGIGIALPHPARRTLHVDHVRPRARGGASTLKNLQTLCESCNCRKSAH